MIYCLNKHLEEARQKELSSGKKMFFISDWNNHINEVSLPHEILTNIQLNNFTKYLEYDDVIEEFKDHLDFIRRHCKFNNEDLDMFLTSNTTSSIHLSIITLIHSFDIKDFLIIKPNYFSIDKIILSNNCNFTEYYMDIYNNKSYMDFDMIEDLITKKNIKTIILTNPIYSLGKEISLQDIQVLVNICNRFDIWLIVDNVYDGLSWTNNNLFINKGIYKTLLSYDKSILLDSPSKKLFLNSLKFGIIYADSKFIDCVDIVNDFTHGSFSDISIQLLTKLYNPINIAYIESIISINISNAKKNYLLYKNIINNQAFFVDINSGYNTILLYRDILVNDQKTLIFINELMNNYNIIAIPNIDFNYKENSNFGIRINLLKQDIYIDEHIKKISGFNFNTFK